MTIASETNKSGPYNGNGSTTAFDYDFKIADEAHVKVILTDSSGVEIVQTLTTDYTVSGVGDPGGGSITMLAAPASGEEITLILDVPFTQTLDLENQGAYNAEDVEAALDLAAQRDLQLKEEIDRSVKIPASSDILDLDALTANVLRLGESADEVDTVAGIAADVTAVAAIAADVTTVAGIAADVTAIASISADVATVAGVDDEVVAVAGNAANINAVASIDSDVTTVASVAAAVSTVAANDADISTVAANVTDVTNFADVYFGPSGADPTLRSDGSVLQAGDLYFNTVTDLMKVYTGDEWRDASAMGLNMVADAFTGDGVEDEFTLSTAPGLAANVLVWVDGVRQVPITDYTVSGAVLTFDTAPDNLAEIETLVVATTAELLVPANGSVTADAISNDPGEQTAIRQKIGAADDVLETEALRGDVDQTGKDQGWKDQAAGNIGVVFTRFYESAEQTITAGGALTLAHGLGGVPKLMQAVLVCKTAELGFSVGDELWINNNENKATGSAAYGQVLVGGATNISVRFGSGGNAYAILRKDTGAGDNMTAANWRFKVRAAR